MRYVSVYLPADEDRPEEEFFDTEEEAWNHIGEDHLCRICKEALRPEGVTHSDGSVERCSCPEDTPCGAEWWVLTEERWKECLEDDDDEDEDDEKDVPEEPEPFWWEGMRMMNLEVSLSQGVAQVLITAHDGGTGDVITVVSEPVPEDGDTSDIRRRFLDAVDGFYAALRDRRDR